MSGGFIEVKNKPQRNLGPHFLELEEEMVVAADEADAVDTEGVAVSEAGAEVVEPAEEEGEQPAEEQQPAEDRPAEAEQSAEDEQQVADGGETAEAESKPEPKAKADPSPDGAED